MFVIRLVGRKRDLSGVCARSRGRTGKGLRAGKFFPLVFLMAALVFCSCEYGETGAETEGGKPNEESSLKIGWAESDISPEGPAILTGQRYLRVSEGAMDPITATALALESGSGEGVIMISCDLISIPDEISGGDFRGKVRERVSSALPDGEIPKVVLFATHTHAGPEIRTAPGRSEKLRELGVDVPEEWQRWGVELEAVPPPEYVDFATERIAAAAAEAWENRAVGGISFGLSHAVVGHNRIMTYDDGASRMYGPTDTPDFRHVEGWEDHSVNLMYTWDKNMELTGLIVNIPSPAQHDEGAFELSADFYHQTREELRDRLGRDIYVLAQNSAAGDKSERVMIHRRAERRMERITGKNRRESIAGRVADAVESILPYMKDHVDWDPLFAQSLEKVELSRQTVSVSREEYESALESFEEFKERYLIKRRKIEERPEIRERHRWYQDLADAYRDMWVEAGKIADYREQQRRSQETEPTMPVEIYVLRLGDMAFASNPFELYLDFGVRIQERSEAVQTFIVQLAGSGSYVAPERSVEKGAYGSRNRLFKVPEAGRELVEHTLALINGKFGLVKEVELRYGLEKADSARLPREDWRFREDPDDAGRELRWYDPEYDDTDWRGDVPIEISWQNHLEENYHGAAWYRRSLEPAQVKDWKKAFLHFEGVDEQAWVWVNGEFVGEHTVASEGKTVGELWDAPFALEITELFKPGEINYITVRVENTVGAGGIWRPVTLYIFK